MKSLKINNKAIALEPRIMFDAAAVDTVMDTLDNHDNQDPNHNDTTDNDHSDHITPLATSSVSTLKDDLYNSSSMIFEQNQGQFAEEVNYIARGENYTIFITDDGTYLSLTNQNTGDSSVLKMDWVGGNDIIDPTGINLLNSKSNYMIGDQANWITDVNNYGQVMYENTYDGIDMILYGSNEGKLEYDFIVDSGSDYSQITLNLDGADNLSIDGNGNLQIETSSGTLTQRAPIAYQIINGEKVYVDASFIIKEDNNLGFDIGEYDASQKLYIDPVLHYSTYLGSDSDEVWNGGDIATDDDGNIYVTGSVHSSGFPTSTGVQSELWLGSEDAFLTKYDKDGIIIYSTYLGGASDDFGTGLAIDPTGEVYVTGKTNSTDFPVTSGSLAGGGSVYNAFIARLDTSGVVDYGIFYGANDADTDSSDIAIDSGGNVYITGTTSSTNLTTTVGAQFTSSRGGDDAYIARFNNLGQLTYGSYLGGTGQDKGLGVDVDASGNFYVAGQTGSLNFLTKNQQQVNQAGEDLYVTKFNADGSVAYSTYIGGDNDDTGSNSMIAVSDDGRAYIVGTTASSDYVTKNAFDAELSGNLDGVVTALDSDGGIMFSTYFGGEGNDGLTAVSIDAENNIFATGYTEGTIATIDGIQPTAGGMGDAVIVRYNQFGELTFASYLGGENEDRGFAIAADGNSNIYILGTTSSMEFPTESPEQGALDGISDYFVSKIYSNAAPNITGAVDPEFTTISEIDLNNDGDLIQDILEGVILDIDGPEQGIAIIDTGDPTKGGWQYSTNNGQTWTDVGTVDETQALLLAADNFTKLRFVPINSFYGTAQLTFRAWDQSDNSPATTKVNVTTNGRGTAFSADTDDALINVIRSLDPPIANNTTTTEDTMSATLITVLPDPSDVGDVTHFYISDVTEGSVYLADGVTLVENETYITVEQGALGLRWMPSPDTTVTGVFNIRASIGDDGSNIGQDYTTCNISIVPAADTPTVSDATTYEDTISNNDIIITQYAHDTSETSHYKITNILNGSLYLADQVTQVHNGDFITLLQGAAGLTFRPDADSIITGTFNIQASTGNSDSGLGGDVITANIHIIPVADDPTITNASADEDIFSTPIVLSRNTNDGAEIAYFKITDIQNGRLFLGNETTEIFDGQFITAAQATSLKFLSLENDYTDGSFNAQASVTADDSGLGGSVVTSNITINPVADAPIITIDSLNANPNVEGYIVNKNPVDGMEVTHFQITNITNGSVYLDDMSTMVSEGEFITIEQGLNGLVFLDIIDPDISGQFTITAATGTGALDVSPNSDSATLTIDFTPEAPQVTDGHAIGSLLTSENIIITRNANNGPEVQFYKITNINNGELYKADGTRLYNGDFISIEEGAAGLSFKTTVRDNCSFDVQSSLYPNDLGVGVATTTARIYTNLLPAPHELDIINNEYNQRENVAQQRENSIDFIHRQEERVKFKANLASVERVVEPTYERGMLDTLTRIKKSLDYTNQNIDAQDDLILSDAIANARQAGTVDGFTENILSLIDGTAYLNNDVNRYGLEGESPLANPLDELYDGKGRNTDLSNIDFEQLRKDVISDILLEKLREPMYDELAELLDKDKSEIEQNIEEIIKSLSIDAETE